MLRKILLPSLAAATLAGCATGYTYRGGNGDYYYGQPRTEYRYQDPYGYYGLYGGYGYGGGGYYYDRYGRLVYGYPFGYSSDLHGGYGSWWYRPRPPRGHHGGGHDDGGDGDGHDADRNDRRPPWRDFGGTQPRRPGGEGDARPRQRRQTAPADASGPLPQRERRFVPPAMPRLRDAEGSGAPRTGRVLRGAKSAPTASGE